MSSCPELDITCAMLTQILRYCCQDVGGQLSWMEFGSIRDAARLSGNLPRGTGFRFSSGAFFGRLPPPDRLGFTFPASLLHFPLQPYIHQIYFR
jgi:hypothetical protein